VGFGSIPGLVCWRAESEDPRSFRAPDRGLLLPAVMQVDEKLKMPLSGGKFKEDEIADLRYWIQIGAPWPHVEPRGKKCSFLLTFARPFDEGPYAKRSFAQTHRE
jgi:hypothetical protein